VLSHGSHQVAVWLILDVSQVMRFAGLLFVVIGIVSASGCSGVAPARKSTTVRVILAGDVSPVGEVMLDSPSLFHLLQSGRIVIGLLATHAIVEHRGSSTWDSMDVRKPDRDILLRDGNTVGLFMRTERLTRRQSQRACCHDPCGRTVRSLLLKSASRWGTHPLGSEIATRKVWGRLSDRRTRGVKEGRIWNILMRFSTLAVLHRFEPPSRAIMERIITLLHAHGFSARVEDVRQDLLAAAEGLIATGSERFVGVSYKELSSMGLLQVKFTYEPAR
jgi:hypothetical protein